MPVSDTIAQHQPIQATTDLLPRICFSLLILFAFLLFSPVVTGDYDGDGALTGAGDSARQAAFVLLFALVLATAVNRRGAAALFDVPLAIVLLLAWCWLSVAWAIDPAVALRRVAFTTILTLTVTYTVGMLNERAVVSSLCGWFTLILVLDWLAIALVPLAVHPAGGIDAALAGNWRGIHTHKNEAGAVCAIAALLFLDRCLRGRSTITAPLMLALSLGFLVMTASKTSEGFVIAGAGGGALMVTLYRNPWLRRGTAWAAGLALMVALVFFGDRLGDLFAIFDDPGSLTGRVQIWPVLLRYASSHAALGSGYGSFWAIGEASPVYQDGPTWLRTISHAHNGYLDILIQTGAVGLALALLGLVARPLYRLSSKPVASPGSRWLLGAILTYCWLHDLLESSLLDRANVVWILLLIAYTLLERNPAGALPAIRADDPIPRNQAAAAPSNAPITAASAVTRM